MITLRTALILIFCSTSFLSGMDLPNTYGIEQRKAQKNFIFTKATADISIKKEKPPILENLLQFPEQKKRIETLLQQSYTISNYSFLDVTTSFPPSRIPPSRIPLLIEHINSVNKAKQHGITENILGYAAFEKSNSTLFGKDEWLRTSLFCKCLESHATSVKKSKKLTPTNQQHELYKSIANAHNDAQALCIPFNTDRLFNQNKIFNNVAYIELEQLHDKIIQLILTPSENLTTLAALTYSDMYNHFPQQYAFFSSSLGSEGCLQALYRNASHLLEHYGHDYHQSDITLLYQFIKCMHFAQTIHDITEKKFGKFAHKKSSSVLEADLSNYISILSSLIETYHASRQLRLTPTPEQYICYMRAKKLDITTISDMLNENQYAFNEFDQLYRSVIIVRSSNPLNGGSNSFSDLATALYSTKIS